VSTEPVNVPAAFWANFANDFIEEAVNPADSSERLRRYANHETYENWTTGVFSVRFKDGRTETYSGVMFDADGLNKALGEEPNA
jgi:hypothetical protein